jgi:hypothetical protein
LLNLSLYKAYILRLYRYLTRNHQPHKITNPIPVFKEILTSLRNATEEALGAKMNTTDSFYGENNIYMYVSAPWELNYTYTHAMRHAMKELGMRIHNRYYELEPKPWTAWHNHSNDEKDYCGVNGTLYAFEQARDLVEMMEYDPFYRYGDFRCGTAMVAACFRIEREMKANGTWVEPPRKGVLDFECQSWRECLTAWPWKSELDGEYSRFRLENWEEHPDKNGYAELLRT